jgi:hypothetical protein
MGLKEIEDSWYSIWSDRLQRMVFLGDKESLPRIKTELQKCLMTDDELETDLKVTVAIPDPFENWKERLKMLEATEGA